MARWKDIRSATGGTLKGTIQYDKGDDARWEFKQDETPFIDEAKRERDAGTKKTHNSHRKFATIPDIVAIEILNLHGIDIHDPNIMKDRNKMQRFKNIIMKDYKYLVVNNA